MSATWYDIMSVVFWSDNIWIRWFLEHQYILLVTVCICQFLKIKKEGKRCPFIRLFNSFDMKTRREIQSLPTKWLPPQTLICKASAAVQSQGAHQKTRITAVWTIRLTEKLYYSFSKDVTSKQEVCNLMSASFQSCHMILVIERFGLAILFLESYITYNKVYGYFVAQTVSITIVFHMNNTYWIAMFKLTFYQTNLSFFNCYYYYYYYYYTD